MNQHAVASQYTLLDGVESGAVFSPCRLYRYQLWRKWAHGSNILCWIMLNPSTATEDIVDPTVFRCIKRARSWGYDGVLVLNLFAWRSTDPRGLISDATDPVGEANDENIIEGATRSTTIVCAWGSASPLIPKRAEKVVTILRNAGLKLHYLRMSETTGQPWHPLYVPLSQGVVEWIVEELKI